jgi:hypothetical protein
LNDFFIDFSTASQHILDYVGQEAVLKDMEKDSKSMFFILLGYVQTAEKYQ